jgi:hypothetical protein
MKRVRSITLAACVLVGAGAANAGVTSVSQTLDYTFDVPNTWYFWPPTAIVDHAPFHRHSWEDWGWTHTLGAGIPADATDILGATLSIVAWGVDDTEGEVDIVSVDGVPVGMLEGPSNGVPAPPVPPETYLVVGQPNTLDTRWSVTTFTLSPAALQTLLVTDKLKIFLNIDAPVDGERVTIRSSTLTVNYATPGDGGVGEVAEPNATVYRFWSSQLGAHFYTISEEEKDFLIANFGYVWTFEGVAYHVFGAALNADIKPIYRFWSSQLGTHFYTISEEEADFLIANFWYIWTFEGVAFYAYPEGHQPEGTKPVYRFWSASLGRHVYTLRDDEKQVLEGLPNIWTLEGVAWYAYE